MAYFLQSRARVLSVYVVDRRVRIVTQLLHGGRYKHPTVGVSWKRARSLHLLSVTLQRNVSGRVIGQKMINKENRKIRGVAPRPPTSAPCGHKCDWRLNQYIEQFRSSQFFLCLERILAGPVVTLHLGHVDRAILS